MMSGLSVSLWEGLRDILKNPLRSAITAMATMLSAASIVFTWSLVEGSVRELREFLERVGGVEIFHVNNSRRLTTRQEMMESSPGLTMDDVSALRYGLPQLRGVAPVLSHWPPFDFEHGNRRYSHTLIGTTTENFEASALELEAGRFLTDFDVTQCRRVLVLGSAAARRLGIETVNFKETKVRMGSLAFTVVGVLKPQAFWLDGQIQLPITTLFTVFFPARVEGGVFEPMRTRLDQIIIRLARAADIESAIDAIRRLLLETHNGVEDFGFDTRESWSEDVDERVRASESTGLFIVLVCLGVAGLSLANVLLASLRQRIREIGIRMSVGCRPWQIFVQVLAESALLCVLGSLAGVFLGGWISGWLGEVSPAVLAPTGAWQKFFAFWVVVGCGVAASVVPALRCARLKPVQALSADLG
jgi:putative ABC transport system permease protein